MEVNQLLKQLNDVIYGKSEQVRLSIACLLSGGHLLIEDLPGMGKTTLAQAVARSLGLKFKRIQFTSDMLPSDILGVSIYSREKESFVFKPGPVFTQMLLADEINRTHPKTQSALLEAMEERQVTVDGKRYKLPNPFFVVASQNPTEQSGTFKLPESQLDRFAMRISLGYPSEEAELKLLSGDNPRELIEGLAALSDAEGVLSLRIQVARVTVSDAINRYLLRLIRASREKSGTTGLSPRAGLALQRAAQAYAMLQQRNHVIPDDVQAVFASVAGHRLMPNGSVSEGDALCARLLSEVDVL